MSAAPLPSDRREVTSRAPLAHAPAEAGERAKSCVSAIPGVAASLRIARETGLLKLLQSLDREKLTPRRCRQRITLMFALSQLPLLGRARVALVTHSERDRAIANELLDLLVELGRSGWGQWEDVLASAVNTRRGNVEIGERDVERLLAPLVQGGLVARRPHESGAVYLTTSC